MKKFLFIALFIAGFASTTSAQQRHGYSQTTYIIEEEQPKERKKLKPVEPGYQSTVEYAVSTGSLSSIHLFDYIGGYRFNNTLFAGAGIGIGTTGLGGFSYRIFAHTKAYLTKTRMQPFFAASIGYGGLNSYGYFIANPEVGGNYRITNKLSAFLSVGYGYIARGSCATIKLGVTF